MTSVDRGHLDGLPRSRPRRDARARHPRDREPERRDARWLDAHGGALQEARCRRDRAQRLCGGDRPVRVERRRVEERLLRLVHAVRRVVSVPVAVKLSPYFTAFANVALQLADARVGRSRALQPLRPAGRRHRRDGGCAGLELSRRDELRARAPLARDPPRRVDVSLAATGGVHTTEDAVKAILAGADVVTMTSALLARRRRTDARGAARRRRLARRARDEPRRGARAAEPDRVRQPARLRARAVRRDGGRRQRDALAHLLRPVERLVAARRPARRRSARARPRRRRF